MANVCAALVPVLAAASACVATAVYVPSPRVVTLVDHVAPLRVTERVRTGVPLAAVPEYTLTVTVVASPEAEPAAPDSVIAVVFEEEPSAGVVSGTAGATQSDAVVTVDVKWSVTVNAAWDPRTPWPATASAASAPRAA